MMEPQDIARYKRHASALAAKANDPEGLAQMADIVAEFQAQLTVAANRLHRGDDVQGAGFSWTELARPLGISRQAARQKFAQ